MNRKHRKFMKKNFFKTGFFLISLFITSLITIYLPVSAAYPEATRPARLRLENVRENKETIKEKIKSKRATLIGTITSLSTSQVTLAVTKGEMTGKSVVVNITSETKILRRFEGKSTLAEFSINDEINVLGKWTDDIKTALDAKVIRNLSIQKRHGSFIGTIGSLGTNSFVINSVERGPQTVTISSSTRLVDRREQSIVFSDLVEGNRIRVKGLWDKKNNTITEVRQVKNFSLPIKPNEPSPTATP